MSKMLRGLTEWAKGEGRRGIKMLEKLVEVRVKETQNKQNVKKFDEWEKKRQNCAKC